MLLTSMILISSILYGSCFFNKKLYCISLPSQTAYFTGILNTIFFAGAGSSAATPGMCPSSGIEAEHSRLQYCIPLPWTSHIKNRITLRCHVILHCKVPQRSPVDFLFSLY